MFKEHEIIALTADLPEEGLEAGDVGTIVHIHGDGEAFIVEFMTFTGRTVAVAEVPADQVRPISDFDVKQARPMTTVGWAGVPSTEDVSMAPVAAGKKRRVATPEPAASPPPARAG